jgi:hypothetical protein
MSINPADYTLASAIHSFGCQVFAGAFTAPTPDVLTELYDLLSISFNGETFTPIEVSHMFSPHKYKEFIPGFGDSGEISMSFNWGADLMEAVIALMPQGDDDPSNQHGRRRLILSSPMQDTIMFKGYFNGPGFQAQLDAKIEIPTLTFRTSGPPVFTAAA